MLSDRIGAETYVFLYEDWIPDELERLSFFAMLYIERARDLVRLCLTTRDKPENVVYAVGFFVSSRDRTQTESHDRLERLVPLSDAARAAHDAPGSRPERIVEDRQVARRALVTEDEIEPFEGQLLELDRLDERSDGFRYPFRFVDRESHRQSLLGGLSFKSFDDFVWILEGLSAWVKSLQDEEERHREYESELARDAGW